MEEPKRVRTEDIREKENIRLVVSDEELHKRMNYWKNREDLLKPYVECSLCDVCTHCDFRLRDDAKYYVNQLFMHDKKLIKDKTMLISYVLSMRTRMAAITHIEEVSQQLLYCTVIRFIRKMAIETTVNLSDTETERVLKRLME